MERLVAFIQSDKSLSLRGNAKRNNPYPAAGYSFSDRLTRGLEDFFHFELGIAVRSYVRRVGAANDGERMPVAVENASLDSRSPQVEPQIALSQQLQFLCNMIQFVW